MAMIDTARIKSASFDRELHWLVNDMVRPELPSLIEALHICSNLLLYNSPQHPDSADYTRGPSITLPVSSAKDEISGILVRDGAYITKMTVAMKERHFNRVLSRLHLCKPFLLPQILTAKRSIDNAVALLVQAGSVFDPIPNSDSEVCEDSHQQLRALFGELLRELQTAKNSLQLPTQPELVFPSHVASPDRFDPPLSPHIAVDLYISQAEVCIDLKDLARVTESPWGDIDPATGKSHVDTVRDRMSSGQEVAESRPESKLGSVFHLLRPRLEPHDYIARCVTYNGMVVMVNKKIEVSSADPVLVSAFTKLDSVEHMVSSFLENIGKLCAGSEKVQS